MERVEQQVLVVRVELAAQEEQRATQAVLVLQVVVEEAVELEVVVVYIITIVIYSVQVSVEHQLELV